MKRVHPVLVGIVAVLVLTACSGSDDEASSDSSTPESSESSSSVTSQAESTSPSEPTASSEPEGAIVTGTGYSVELPDGWHDVTEQAQQANARADIAIGEPQQPGEFRMNFNVVQPSPLSAEVSEDALAAQAAKELRSVTHAKVVPLKGPEFDDAPSIGQASHTTSGDLRVTLVQYLVQHRGKLYPTTLTFDTSREDEAQTVMKGIVESWAWA